MEDKIVRKVLRKTPPNREFYNLRSILGYANWAIFYFLIGAREAGKSYAVMEYFVRQWKSKSKPFIWLRLTETSQKKLLTNKADKLVDPDIRRRYDLDLTVKGTSVYDHGKKMAEVLALSTFYSDKGVALYDSENLLGYNICLDEMNREQNEKRGFDILYAFTNQMENLVRSTKDNIKVFLIGNTLEEASDLMCAFNFLPEEFGRYKLKKKRAVIDYLPPSQKYLERRKGTIADILTPTASTFTNMTEVDTSLVYKGAIYKPTCIFAFSKDKADWFVLWDSKVIRRYKGEKVDVIPMRPYLDYVFDPIRRDNTLLLFDQRFFVYCDLITFKLFKKNLSLLKPRK